MVLLPEVQEKVNRPFSVKLAETKDVIAHHVDEFGDKVAVAFSGGKDSELVLYFTWQINPRAPVVFNNTGVEYPETVQFVADLQRQWALNLIVTHPEKTFWQCTQEYGFPKGSKRHGIKNRGGRCCYWLKEKPMVLAIREHGWLGYFTGESAVESRLRMFWARDRGMCFHLKHERVCKVKPLLWWTEAEVWEFIRDNGLPYNPIYDKGAHRVGCMPCTAYKNWESELLKLNPKLYSILKLRKDGKYVMPIEVARGE